MIAKIKIGKNFIGALEYNTNKINDLNPKECAELLETNLSSLDSDSVKMELTFIEQLNPKLERTTFHTSLSFGKDEIVSNEKMLAIAKEYMSRMGFVDNLFAIVRHNDTDHPHCHILCHRISLDGKTVSDSNSYHQSNEILRDLEQKYDLLKVNSIYNSNKKNITKNEIEYTLRTEKPTVKVELELLVSRSKESAVDINDFINRLEQKGVKVFFKQDSGSNPIGLLFHYKDIVISASKLNKGFVLPRILEYFELQNHPKLPEFADHVNKRTNQLLESQGLRTLQVNSKGEGLGIFMKAVINQVLSNSKSICSFINSLESNGIYCQFNVAKTGRVTGMNLIHQGKSYKASDIDRSFSYNKIFKKLDYEQVRDSKTISETNTRTRERFGNEVPKGSAKSIREAERQSSRSFQSDKKGEFKVPRAMQANFKSAIGATESSQQSVSKATRANNISVEKTEVTGKVVGNFISNIGSIFDTGFSKDGLNTQRNDKKVKNKPSL